MVGFVFGALALSSTWGGGSSSQKDKQKTILRAIHRNVCLLPGGIKFIIIFTEEVLTLVSLRNWKKI